MTKKQLWRHPKGYWYVRLHGKYHRITAPEGTAGFDHQYWEILNRGDRLKENSVATLIKEYRASSRWAPLQNRMQTDYQKVLHFIETRYGSWSTDRLKRKHLIDEMEANRHRIRFANYIVQIASVLYEHAIDLGWAENNPAKGIRKLKTPSGKCRAHVPWPDWAVDRFRTEADLLPRLIFELGIGSVQRPGDWSRFLWSDYDGQSLRLVQSKTGRALWLPCTESLTSSLDRAPKLGLTILAGPDGRPVSYFSMARIMRRERQRLGLTEFDLHALRYRGVMELAWAGCSDDEIAAFSGHASAAMIRKYAGAARQEMRAQSAAEKRSAMLRR